MDLALLMIASDSFLRLVKALQSVPNTKGAGRVKHKSVKVIAHAVKSQLGMFSDQPLVWLYSINTCRIGREYGHPSRWASRSISSLLLT